MKKLLLIATLMMAALIETNAQNESQFHFAGGLTMGLPIGDWSDFWSFGIGAEAQGEYMFSEKVSGVANTGYTCFLGKKVDLGAGEEKMDNMGLIPISVGARVYPSPQFFIGARAGVGIFGSNGETSTGFQYRPEIGYNGSLVQIALGYNGWSKDGGSDNFIGLTALYVFGK